MQMFWPNILEETDDHTLVVTSHSEETIPSPIFLGDKSLPGPKIAYPPEPTADQVHGRG